MRLFRPSKLTSTYQLVQATTTAATVLSKVKKEMTLEARAASKKWAVRRVVARQWEIDKKLAEERAK
jgi:hypothetical protein